MTSYLPLVSPNKRGLKSGHIQVGYLNVDQALCKVFMLRSHAILFNVNVKCMRNSLHITSNADIMLIYTVYIEHTVVM